MKSIASNTCGRSAMQKLLAVATGGQRMRLVLSAIWIAVFALLGQARAQSTDPALSAAIDGAWREPQSRGRDAYRHPYELLTFWGLKPGMTVVEVDPGVRGWWTEILAPYARTTGGHTLPPCLIARSPGPQRKAPKPHTPPFGRASRTSRSSARSKRTTSAHSIRTPFLPDRSTSFWWREHSTTGRFKGTRPKPICAPFSIC